MERCVMKSSIVIVFAFRNLPIIDYICTDWANGYPWRKYDSYQGPIFAAFLTD